MKKSNQEIKVLAINTLYEYAEQFYNYEKEYYSQFLGKDIFKVDGSLKAKYVHERLSFKGNLPDGTYFDAHYWFTCAHGYFDIHVKICVNGGSYDVTPTTAFCQYENQTITLFKVEDGKLATSLADADFLKTRYNLNELKETATAVKDAAKTYEAAYNKMPYIFKEVFNIERLAR